MPKYMIHACHKRMWYVNDFLVPSMLEQGIPRTDIHVWLDWTGAGNLISCVDSFRACGLLPGGTWHMQDDVIISRRFAELTAANDDGLVCGFGNEDFGPSMQEQGLQPASFMWNGFQCLRIPNTLAEEFSHWFYTDAQKRPGDYQRFVQEKKYDDTFFRDFMLERHRDMQVTNLVPNVADHVDYIIGGSVINVGRQKLVYRSAFWEDEDLVEALQAAVELRHK